MTTAQLWASSAALVVGSVLMTACLLALIGYAPVTDDFPRRCALAMGGWHPDIPPAYAERCRKHAAQVRMTAQ
jgi:hypothetical protein